LSYINYYKIGNDSRRKHFIEDGIEYFKLSTIDQLPFEEVQRQLGKTTNYIIKAIKAAFRSNVLQIVDVKRVEEKEHLIEDLFSLHRGKVIIAKVAADIDNSVIRAELVSHLAAHQVFPTIEANRAIGVGAGYTLLRLAELNFPSNNQFNGTEWIPLMGPWYRTSLPRLSAYHIACILTNTHSGSSVFAVPDGLNDSNMDRLLERIPRIPEAFISVNGKQKGDTHNGHRLYSADYETHRLLNLQQQLGTKSDDFKLEILGLFIDLNGNILLEENNKYESNKIAQKGLNILRSIVQQGYVWVIAAGHYKADAVLTALELKLTNALIIDGEIADYLIDKKTNKQLRLWDQNL
jgi:DNA-binding transcriptional regulator LsrR (DeoR family)